MKERKKWAIIGGGNGGQSLAGHLAIMGFQVRLYDIVPETVDAINARGGIRVDGAVEGFGSPELVTTDIRAAVQGADIVMVVAPATAHTPIAKAYAPFADPDQVVILHPGATFGALEFYKVLKDAGCAHIPVISETNTLIYACRAEKPGQASILGIKKDLSLAAFPAKATPRVVAWVQQAFPQIGAGKNIIETSLGNANAMVHPAPTLLNTSMIESRHPWLYYHEGITPTIGAFVEAMDQERLAVAKAYGITMKPLLEWFGETYGVDGDSLSEAVKKNPAYARINGQKEMRTRYLLEDIPTGLVPMISLGKLAGVDVSRMETVVRLGEYLLDESFTQNGRSVENLGLAGHTPESLVSFLESGA